jgi:SAM-dependent methyltransferase
VTRRPTHPAIWEELAQRDAQYHIDPTLGPGASPEEFREGGRGIVDWAMAWAGELPANGRALEIGCGTGRNTIHLARHFRQVDGVDVSPTMVHLALAQGMPSNVRLHSLSGRDLQPLDDGTFDLVFSHLVFQHIEEAADIAAYLREIARVLRIDGVAVLQFDTRPATLAVRLAQALPNALLPHDRRTGIRRRRRDAAEIRRYGADGGLVLEAELAPASAGHWLRWRRPERA